MSAILTPQKRYNFKLKSQIQELKSLLFLSDNTAPPNQETMKPVSHLRKSVIAAVCLGIVAIKVQAFAPTRLSFSPVKSLTKCSPPKNNQNVFLETKLNALPIESMISETGSSILLSDDGQAISGALEGLRTFFIAITAIVFGFAGLTYFTAAVVVPKAAEQLEKDTRRLRPGLWEEFEAKLEPGETMAMRPDVLQELGNIMQPLIIADFEASAEAKASGKPAAPPSGPIDVEVVEKEKPKVDYDRNDQWAD